MRLLLFLVTLASCALQGSAWAQDEISFDSERWTYDVQRSERVEFLGRDSLFLGNGRVWLKDSKFLNCVIEFDIAFDGERGFPGVLWRAQGDGNYEHFYMRPHQSGNPDAFQYTPVFHGVSSWQLYAGKGFSGSANYRNGEWQSVKLEVFGDQARVSVNGVAIVFMGDLKHGAKPGYVGLQVPGFAPAHFSNFRCGELEQDPFGELPAHRSIQERGMVPRWSVSSAFPEKRLTDWEPFDGELQEALSWSPLESEASGLANLARIQGLGQGDTCFARVVLESGSDQNLGLGLGFSDRVKVYLNGQLLYAGDNSYLSRDYRYLGTIGSFDRVYLPLRQGANELQVAVTESFGGWGVMAHLDPNAGVRVQ